jgi:DNA repair protein RecN (Recombination protein N)
MLAELAIDDLLLIASARLQLAPGLNVITGETGAGKTLLAQAVGLLMGQKADGELVRIGGKRALVQAVFQDDGGNELAVGREIPREGRARAFLDGLLSSAAAVEQAVRERVAFYGQLEHARLLHLERQVDLLDASAPAELPALLEAFQSEHGAARELDARLRALQTAAEERCREADLLAFQVREIEAAAPQVGEDEQLAAERGRQRNAEKLLERIGGALTLLAGEADAVALDQLRTARRLIDEAAALDPALGPLSGRLRAAEVELEDAAYGLQAYVEALDADPEHRDAIERRHDTLQALKRKYGATIDEVLRFRQGASARLAELQRESADAEGLEGEVAAARERTLAAAAELSAGRRRRAGPFAEEVTAELRALAMPHARFEVRLDMRGDRWEALARHGAEDVELLFSANPGMPLRPLRETASGGELSRAMLALKSVATLRTEVGTLIFDEVDTGIGGVTATGLGERLARLARRTQIVCITHLPQVVVFAERHFAIEKVSDAQAATTEAVVREVAGEERVAELCRMLGTSPDDAAARAHAQALLARAAEALESS